MASLLLGTTIGGHVAIHANNISTYATVGGITQATADGRYALASHAHSAADITSGTLASARLSGTYTITVSGNATTATTLATARTLTIGSTGKTFNGSANVSWTLAEIGAQAAGSYATDTHTHDLMRHSLRAPANVDSMTSSNFRTQLFGASSSGHNISTARWNSVPSGLSGMNMYGTMLAWSGSDTHGFIATDYSTANIQVGGGSGDSITWRATLIHSGNIGSQSVSYAATSGSITNQANSATITAATAATANTIALRDAAGDIAVREIVLNSGLSTATPTVLVSMFPTTNQLVRTTPAAVAAALSGQSMNINGSATSATTATTTTGNAGSATVLQTARTINGTSFNGSENITTANWGTARTITIGNTGKSVNGSANVSWTLAEIGAQAAGSYLTDGGYYDHRVYTRADNFLGGYYVSGGSEKPNNAIFGAGKLKVAMLSGSNLGFGGSWNDVLWMSTYNGGDVKASYAIVGDKYADELYFSRQNFDSATWGTGRRIWHSGNFDPSSKANSSHTHAISDVTGLQTALDGKAASSHTHTIANVTGLQTALDGKQAAGSYLTTSGKAADSELVDGIDSSRIVFGSGPSKISSHSNANDWRNSGFYENDGGGSNWPSQTWYNSINVRHSNQGNYHGFQVAMSYYDNNLWFRSYQGSGTFQSWAYAISSQNIGSQSVSNATTAGGLAVHTGRNNEANKIVRTQENGYILCGYINSSNGNENNNSNPDRVWGTNGVDDYLRTYRTSALSVAYAASAGTTNNIEGVKFRNTGSNAAINADTLESNGITYYTSGVPNFSGNATDGALYSQAYSSAWQHQIAADYRSGQIALRGKNSGTWQAWRTVLDSSNFTTWAQQKENQRLSTTNDVVHNSTTSPTILVNNQSDNTKGYRIWNTSNSSVSAMFVNSANALVIAAGAVDQVQLNKKTFINGAALGVNVAASATAGRIDASNDIVAYSSSDERLKYNIAPIENALDKVKSLTGVEFDWKPEYKHAHGYEGHDTGIIAQQVEAVMPSAVRTNDTGFLAVRYEKLIGLLIEGMKEQQAQIDELKAKLDGLTK